MVPTGASMPGERELQLHEIAAGLYVVEGRAAAEYDFFQQSPIYAEKAYPEQEWFLDAIRRRSEESQGQHNPGTRDEHSDNTE